MRHRGEVDSEGRGAEIGRIAGLSCRRCASDDGLQRGQNALPVGLADQPKAQTGRHQIGGESLQIADQRIVQRNPGPRRRRPEGGTMADSTTCGGKLSCSLSAPGGGEGWGEVGDSRALADTHLTLPSLRDGPLPLRPEGRRGDLWPPQTGLELRTGCGVWVRVCVAAIETISTVSSYSE